MPELVVVVVEWAAVPEVVAPEVVALLAVKRASAVRVAASTVAPAGPLEAGLTRLAPIGLAPPLIDLRPIARWPVLEVVISSSMVTVG
ncbi:hypothetical protein KBZ14_10300 [Synechococcus sp. HJ21-Hayes]|uniref:hypothetical protein n=1 Tax=unclassified Synechococcus TaxID=2626047 RepID=UPI0020CFB1BE|nr:MULTISPECIES: hypothetical protein [unclassified Synechococcus]MCP9831066.1 hypothetical protein [Synechococcus sp. JJ3a-Johnson]MCP9853254.1 hypothetical protein [Synechococcus sp. HJ21-Hayes]